MQLAVIDDLIEQQKAIIRKYPDNKDKVIAYLSGLGGIHNKELSYCFYLLLFLIISKSTPKSTPNFFCCPLKSIF